MPIAQLNHNMTYQGVAMTNRYFYRTAITINTSILDELMSEFNAVVVPLVKDLQHISTQHVSIDTKEVQGFAFSTLAISGSGSNGGEEGPAWNALSFKLQRGNASTKSGGKRISGLSEANIIGNIVFPDPTYEARIAAYAEVLDDALLGPNATWVPVLVKFDPLNPGVVLADQIIASASFNYLSTQGTRKPER